MNLPADAPVPDRGSPAHGGRCAVRLRAGRGEETPFRRIVNDFAASRIAVFGLALFALILLCALFAPLISPQNPYDLAQLDILDSRARPGARSGDGKIFWLGTDDQGRDMLSAIFYGLRISLGVGVSATLCALALGLAIGLTAAFFGGLGRCADHAHRRHPALVPVDPHRAHPARAARAGRRQDRRSRSWRCSGRTTRARFAAARSSSARRTTSTPRHASRFRPPHRLPAPSAELPAAADRRGDRAGRRTRSRSRRRCRSSASGCRSPSPSLGLLISNGFTHLLSGKYWISFFPGVALLVTIVSINLVGDQLRDVLNPRLQR